MRVVAAARSELHADEVGLGLVFAAEPECEQLAAHVGQIAPAVAQPEQRRADLDGPTRDHGLAHALAGVLAQRVRHLVAHHHRDLVVAELQLVEDAVEESDLAARQAEGVDLLASDQVDLPAPLAGAPVPFEGVRDQALRDRTQPHHLRVAFRGQRILLRRLLAHLRVLLHARLLDLLGRNELGEARLGAYLHAFARPCGDAQHAAGSKQAAGEEAPRVQDATAGEHAAGRGRGGRTRAVR